MTVPARVSLVTIGVTDVEASASFYEALGWRRSSASVAGEVAFFATADSAISLWSIDSLAADLGLPAQAPPSFRGIAFAINVESEAEVDRVLAEALAAGGTVPKPASRAPWGGWTGYFADPDGVVWEVAHNADFAFDERGHLVIGE